MIDGMDRVGSIRRSLAGLSDYARRLRQTTPPRPLTSRAEVGPLADKIDELVAYVAALRSIPLDSADLDDGLEDALRTIDAELRRLGTIAVAGLEAATGPAGLMLGAAAGCVAPARLLDAESAVLWCLTTQNWSRVSDVAYDGWRIKAHPLVGATRTVDHDTDLVVYFPIDPKLLPNVISGQELLYTTIEGLCWCLSPYLDGMLGEIRIWSGMSGLVAGIPDGWQLLDGSDDPQGDPVLDLGGRFLVGFDAEDEDYDALGDEGGNKKQTITHAAHSHGIQQSQQAEPSTGNWIDTGANTWDATVYAHTDVDMRPPYHTVAYIVRVDNSVEWT
jgi:hypothetical protein